MSESNDDPCGNIKLIGNNKNTALECLKNKIDSITDVSDFTPDDYDTTIDGYKGKIKEYVKSKIVSGKKKTDSEPDNINFGKINIKWNILRKIDENSTLTKILELLKYSDIENLKLYTSFELEQYKKDKTFEDEINKLNLEKIDVEKVKNGTQDINPGTLLYVDRKEKHLIKLGNFEEYIMHTEKIPKKTNDGDEIDEIGNIRTGVVCKTQNDNKTKEYFIGKNYLFPVNSDFYKPKDNIPVEAGKRKNRGNRKSKKAKKGKRSRKARKSRRKSNRRR